MKKRLVPAFLSMFLLAFTLDRALTYGADIENVQVNTQEDTVILSAENTPEVAVPLSEETTPEVTASPSEETTPDVTAPPSEETTPEVTAPPSEETTPEVTAPPSEETTPEVTAPPSEDTTPDATVPPSEETMPDVTVPPTEETTPEVTVPPSAETTPDVTAPPSEEITPEVTAPPSEEETSPEVTEIPSEEETTPDVSMMTAEEIFAHWEEYSESEKSLILDYLVENDEEKCKALLALLDGVENLEEETMSFTIQAKMSDGKNPDQDFIFTIWNDNGVSMQVVLSAGRFQNGQASLTISDIPKGNYSVTAEDWSWRYSADNKTKAISNDNSICFTYTRSNDKWFDADFLC